MLTTVLPPARVGPLPGLKGRYRRELRAALDAGIPPETVAMVVNQFRYERAGLDKLDDLHKALVQYADMTTPDQED
jgi:hypothetical protein